MRYAADHKAKTRETVVKAAGAALRRAGPAGVGVAGIMAEAGLTHGGFYAHFRSKDDLIVAAIDRMFADGGEVLRRATANVPPERGLARYIDAYLSPRHRDARDTGCPLAALSGDLPRLSEPARARFARGAAAMAKRLGELLAESGRDDAMAVSMASELVGALALSRAVGDAAQSDAILAASRAALKQRMEIER